MPDDKQAQPTETSFASDTAVSRVMAMHEEENARREQSKNTQAHVQRFFF
jgi:hypothetical protein